jgi:hypothetical protein
MGTLLAVGLYTAGSLPVRRCPHREFPEECSDSPMPRKLSYQWTRGRSALMYNPTDWTSWVATMWVGLTRTNMLKSASLFWGDFAMHPILGSVLGVFTALAVLLLPAQAWAYIDPGSGSMLLQLLLGGVAGLAVVVKIFWHRLLAFFGVKKDGRNTDTPDQG